MKKSLAVIVWFSLLVSLVGCGSGSSTESNDAPVEDKATESANKAEGVNSDVKPTPEPTPGLVYSPPEQSFLTKKLRGGNSTLWGIDENVRGYPIVSSLESFVPRNFGGEKDSIRYFSISPDSEWVLFLAYVESDNYPVSEGSWDLFAQSISEAAVPGKGNSSIIRLTERLFRGSEDQFFYSSASWSTTGDTVLIYSEIDDSRGSLEDRSLQIFTVPSFNQDDLTKLYLEVVESDQYVDLRFSLSPDGEQIAMVAEGKFFGLYLAQIEGGYSDWVRRVSIADDTFGYIYGWPVWIDNFTVGFTASVNDGVNLLDGDVYLYNEIDASSSARNIEISFDDSDLLKPLSGNRPFFPALEEIRPIISPNGRIMAFSWRDEIIVLNREADIEWGDPEAWPTAGGRITDNNLSEYLRMWTYDGNHLIFTIDGIAYVVSLAEGFEVNLLSAQLEDDDYIWTTSLPYQ